jgi:predicted nucleic acid-binding protein
MAIIIDTDVVIKGEKGDFDLRGWLATLAAEEIAVAAVTVAELWHGVERATPPHRSRRERYVATFMDQVSIVPYTQKTALEHAGIWAELESSGKMIGMYDLIVAATAREHGSTVATFNRRHFESVRGLKVTEPRISSL